MTGEVDDVSTTTQFLASSVCYSSFDDPVVGKLSSATPGHSPRLLSSAHSSSSSSSSSSSHSSSSSSSSASPLARSFVVVVLVVAGGCDGVPFSPDVGVKFPPVLPLPDGFGQLAKGSLEEDSSHDAS